MLLTVQVIVVNYESLVCAWWVAILELYSLYKKERANNFLAALLIIMMSNFDSLLHYKGGKCYYRTFRKYSLDSVSMICSARPESF